MDEIEELPALIEAFAHIEAQPVSEIEYRLYYDESGIPLFMTSADRPDGQFILIDKEIYDRADYRHLRVRDGKLVILEDDYLHHQNLAKNLPGFRVVKNHASLVLRDTETYNEEETYGFKNP